MLVENCGNVVLGGGSAADGTALGLCVCHAAFHSCSNDGQLQFRKDGAHLDEGLAHGIDFAVAAVHCNGANNHQPKPLLLDGVHDFAKLLGAARQAADLQGEDGIALIRRV